MYIYMYTYTMQWAASKGTDLATHQLIFIISDCTMSGMSLSIVFLDLVQAFDRIVREIALGWLHMNEIYKVEHVHLGP